MYRVSFVLWSELRCDTSSWCMDVHRAARWGPSSTNDLAGLEALLNHVRHMTVSGDYDECATSVEYNIFLVNVVV